MAILFLNLSYVQVLCVLETLTKTLQILQILHPIVEGAGCSQGGGHIPRVTQQVGPVSSAPELVLFCLSPGWGVEGRGVKQAPRKAKTRKGKGLQGTEFLGAISPAFSVHPDLPQRETQHPLPRVWRAL